MGTVYEKCGMHKCIPYEKSEDFPFNCPRWLRYKRNGPSEFVGNGFIRSARLLI